MESTSNKAATRILTEDHNRVKELMQQTGSDPNPKKAVELLEELFKELEIHARVEERLVYPVLATADQGMAQELAKEHASVRRLVSRFRLAQAGERDLGADNRARIAPIFEQVEQHIAEEEHKAFPLLDNPQGGAGELGHDITKLKSKLATFPPVVRWVDVHAPVGKVYEQWAQFEHFPRFLDGIKEVRRLDECHLRWVADMPGKDVEWTAEIQEMIPDETIAWTSQEGALHRGSVSFRALDPSTTRILAEITYEPQGLLEDLGALVGVLGTKVQSNLEHFKKYVELRPDVADA